MTVPLSILDLAPVPTGSSTATALRNTIDLARRAEAAGYHRYWLAEHHLAPGVASSAPTVLIGQVAAATTRIRVGSGAVQLGHRTPLATVEEFGTIDALHPGRIDLGIGRSGGRPPATATDTTAPATARAVGGLLIPPPFTPGDLLRSPRFAAHATLLRQPGATTPPFTEQIDDLTALLAGTYRTADGIELHATPGEGADVELWLLGSSGGESARVAGALGLPFAANYHVSPGTVLAAVDAYRAAFRPSARLTEPYLMVSADVLVADDTATARRLAEPYGLWVRSIRTGDGAIAYPTPEQAAAHAWTDADRTLVADRLDTRFVGTPEAVTDRLHTLQKVTGADELLVTTITHDHADRVRSHDLLARAWY
ncbi:LLM class flavin-dependent oxidoreductase [Actinocatenispora rupis]|uniref:Putative monooxygenase (Luciferase-like) n=1 Tax=Actinocatenispora rupis TaxID=519421 RepID=A0A8J3J184_9ACTN|nr:LLM class flavin-dependent oxidoreductase [Actinocatenispora rupis]GID10112.1 putative monooxygenase (luciferase-like) [Actinocatenispora rupis]